MSYSKVGTGGLSVDAVKTSHILDGAVTTSKINIDSALSANSNNITNLSSPINPNDAVNKAYADAVIQGLDTKQSVRLSTTSNIVLSGIQTIDGILGIANDRILVKTQTTASENGLYIMQAGTWIRTTDANTNAEVTSQLYTFVEEGLINKNNGFNLITPDPIVLGTTNLTFAQFSGAGSILAGAALLKTGNQLDVQVDNSSIEVIGNNLQLKALGVTNSHLATTSVDNAKLALLSVATGNIQDGSISAVKLAGNSVNALKLEATVAGLGLSLNGISNALDINTDNTGIEVLVDTLQLKNLGVTSAKIAVDAVDKTKVAADIAGLGIVQAIGGELDVNVDNSSIEIITDTVQVKALGITDAMLAGSISDSKLSSIFVKPTNVDNTTIEYGSGNLNIKALGVSNVEVSSSIITGQTETINNSNLDSILIYDASLSSLRKMTRANFISGIVTGSAGDIQETSFIAANNVIVPTSVTGFAHANATVRSFRAIVSVEVFATTGIYEVFDIIGIQKGVVWDMTYTSAGDISGINFTINASGQILYTSSNAAGYTSSKIKFRSIVTSF